MGRVTTLAPRVSCAPSRLSTGAPVVPTYGQGRGGRPWRRKRELVMKRDGYLCQCEDCQEAGRLPLEADEVDHIVPVAEGGTDDDSNLRAINHDCHKAKTQAEARRGAARS